MKAKHTGSVYLSSGHQPVISSGCLDLSCGTRCPDSTLPAPWDPRLTVCLCCRSIAQMAPLPPFHRKTTGLKAGTPPGKQMERSLSFHNVNCFVNPPCSTRPFVDVGSCPMASRAQIPDRHLAVHFCMVVSPAATSVAMMAIHASCERGTQVL